MNDKNTTEQDSADWDDFFARKLKSLSSTQIEVIIASALGKAADCDYQAELKTINFEPFVNAASSDATELRILISKKIKKHHFKYNQ